MGDNKAAYASTVYDARIDSVLPYYREYHAQAIDLARALGLENPRWLDTGCGTGTLAARVLEELPNARLTLADPSESMLGVARQKLAGREVRFLNLPSQALPFNGEFDVVTAIQCHHYFRQEEREAAICRCRRALRDGGIFVTFENIQMSTAESEALALRRWSRFLAEHGASPDEIQMQIARRGTEVFPITIEEHLALLKKCGFRSVNLLWASYLQAGFWAVK
ncbi:MAG: class I SAM-dependent methyltransferase [bacterium]